MKLIDKKLVERRFASHFDTYNNHAVVQQEICSRLVEHLSTLNLSPQRGLEIGAGTGFLTSGLLSLYPSCSWILNDISPKAAPYLDQIVRKSGVEVEFMFGDAEHVDFGVDFDLIASASVVQWFDSIEAFIGRLPVESGSIVAISTFAPQNFKEIAHATESQGLTYYNGENFVEWFEKTGFESLLCENFERVVEFETPIEVLRHLRYTGVNAIENVSWSRGKLDRFCEKYQKSFSSKNGVLLTYNPLIMVFRKK